MRPLTSLSLVALSAMLACNNDSNAAGKARDTPAPAQGPYHFDRPAARFTLPYALREISGLTVLGEGYLGAVQDEAGELYILSTETGEVATVVPFGPPGDYEGIERVGDRLFALRSDGVIMELLDWASGRASVRTFETELGSFNCNAEGLGTDGGRLLIACKEEASDGRSPIYAFDLSTETLTEASELILDRNAGPGKEALRPSALAVDPISGRTVVLSSRREALISITPGGSAAVEVWDIRPAGLPQPEGLAFLPNGDLFISSEGGKRGLGLILRFDAELE